MHNPSDLMFMEEALRLAEEAGLRGEVPVGAVVVHDGTIIGRGSNRREELQDFSAHAEFLAMQEATRFLGSWRLSACTVYVTLEPCPMCAGAMVLSRIHRCVFGASDPKGGYLGTLHDLSAVPALNHQFIVEGGVMESACGGVLRAFFQALRRR